MSAPLHLLTARDLLVCVPTTLPAASAGALRDLLVEAPSVDAVLEELTASGLRATPPFLCAAHDPEGVRVVIRGDVSAVAHGRDGSTVALGAGRSATWNDDVISDIAAITIDLGPDGSRFEWLAQPAPAPAAPAPPPPADPEPTAPTESHTLDETAFAELRPDPPAPASPPPPPPPPATAPPPPPPPPPADPMDFSQLLDSTVHRGAPAPPPTAAPPPPPPAPAPAPAPAPVDDPTEVATGLGEHDGRTITLEDLRQLREPTAAPTGREVRAVRCPAGHPNPTTAAQCQRCGAEITDRTVAEVPRPVVARLVFESGLIVEVDRPQVIGRRPTAPDDVDDVPGLVTLPSPDGEISRAHTAVRLEGWDLLIEDLGSTNGTEVRLPGRDPVRLREHEPLLAVIGTEVALAAGARFTIAAPEH